MQQISVRGGITAHERCKKDVRKQVKKEALGTHLAHNRRHGDEDAVVYLEDERKGKHVHRHLAPVISGYACDLLKSNASTIQAVSVDTTLKRKVIDLHPRWGKYDLAIRREANEEQDRLHRCNIEQNTREIMHKQLSWEPDSISQAAFDPD